MKNILLHTILINVIENYNCSRREICATLYAKMAETNCSISSRSDMPQSDNAALLKNNLFQKLLDLEINKYLTVCTAKAYSQYDTNKIKLH